MKRIIYLIIPVLIFILSCEDKDNYNVKFSYQGIIDKEYRFNVGRVIPVTIGQAIETDGDISRDGKYFYYSSNSDGGNYDIYLRSMTDITTVRLTSHPSKDITPVVSPDGKRIAFVSFRDDPEGDVFVMKINPADLIKKEEESVSNLASLDNIAENLTIEKEADTGVIINIKDAYPSWSPDGKQIVYTSSKGGMTNLWIMKADGSDKKQISVKGGEYPSFSMDGNKIVFVSYRENEHGDIYTVDVNTGKEIRITSDKNIKLYPSFMNDESRIIYSSIEYDTSKNGSLDLQDRSIIRYIDTKNNLSYPLTKYSDSSFKARWLPVLQTRDYSGVIIYTDITGENINLNIIPETGIIPKKLNAKLQYEMCETYIAEYDDTEKYLLSLESVYNYYGRNSDSSSQAYVNRALEEAAFYYKKTGDVQESKRIISFIKKHAEKKDQYASFILDMIGNSEKNKNETDFESVAKKFGSEKSGTYFIPFALEDIADIHFKRGAYSSALKIFNYIIAKYPEFERSLDIHTKISLCSDDLRKTGISDSAVNVLNKGNTNQKITIIKHLIDPVNKTSFSLSEADLYLTKISALKVKYKDDKKIMAVLSHISGVLYGTRGQVQKSREDLQDSITLSHPNDLTYYLSNIKLGEIERRQSRFIEAEKYFSAGISRYSRRFKTENFKEKLLWLINYYEQTGERSELAGDFKEAAGTYDKLINLITLMHNKRLYPEVYSEFAAKAHVQYIDSYTAWKGEASIDELKKSYEEKLPVFRMDFNRAAIYGLGYIYTKKGFFLNSSASGNEEKSAQDEVYDAFKKADEQIDWALFIDDTFIEPYILKSWIYQVVDSDRNSGGDDVEKYIGRYFPKHLWEENIVILEKALNANNENVNPENEGNLHLNMANNYFLLLNYPRALKSYRLAEKYKKNFGTDIENALFHFHMGYTLWQNNEISSARNEIKKAYGIYDGLSSVSGDEKFKYQYLVLYRYFALFSRYEEKYMDAAGWYKKIIRFAGDNNLTIDGARYLQEIANCYIKTGDFERAKNYLERAAVMLEKYPDDERKYYLKIKLFGIIGPFPLFNLGADSVVIGDNKIFHPLDTMSKKLLNISMFEEIALANSDYTTAIKYLKEKIQLLEKSGTAVATETRIRSLNNLGFYSYISGKFNDAEDFFNKAGDLATETGNLNGISSSMMNLVNLYALMIEDEKHSEKNWKNTISGLISRIESHRKNYYNLRLAQEKEALKQKAKLKKTEVTEDQIAEITSRVEEETTLIYDSLDIASAVLKYYLAEIFYATDPVLADKKTQDAVSLYSINRDVFNLYTESLKDFESSIIAAGKKGNGELQAKLLINAGVCYERTGDYEKAYVSFIDAKNSGEKNSLSWIKINASHKLADFLSKHGKEVEKTDSSTLAEKNYNSAISEIEEYPALYTSYANRIKIIYRDYISFLIDKGREQKAFELAERYSQVARIIYVNSLSPEFSNEYDRKKYYEFTSELGKRNKLSNDMSSLLLSGKEPLSPEVAAVKKNIFLSDEKLNSLRKEIRSGYSSIRPYLEMSGYKVPSINYDIYRFHETDRGPYFWKISKGKMTSGYVKDGTDSLFSAQAPGFVLLSDTVIDMVNKGVIKPSANCIFINSMDRIQDYLNDSNTMSGNIFSEEKGLSGAVAEGVDVTEGGDKPFADYSIIIDRAGYGNDITAETLFSSSISPVCLIQTGIKPDYQYLLTVMEGAFYAGTGFIVVTPGTGSETVLPIIKKLYGNTEQIQTVPAFTLGYINSYNEKPVSDNKKISDMEFSLFSGYMKSVDFVKASVHLSRWNSLQKDKNSYTYTGNLWLVELLSGEIKESLKVLESYSPKNDVEKSGIKFRKVYTLLYSGDIPGAENEMSSFTEDSGDYADAFFIREILKISRYGDTSVSDRISAMKKPYKTFLPAERYLMLIAQYLFLYDAGKAEKIASLIPDQPYLSESEHLMKKIISGTTPPAGMSIRYDRIAALFKIKDLSTEREEALKLLYGIKGYDYLSVYPVIETIILHEGKDADEDLIQFLRSVDLKRIVSRSDFITAVMLLRKIDNLFSVREEYQERVAILNDLETVSSAKSLDSIKKETVLNGAINYSLMENYEESFKKALFAEEIFTPDDRNYADLQLLRMNLYIKSGKYKEAETKGAVLSKIQNLQADRKYMLNLQLSLIELNRLRSLKKVTVSDAAVFENLFIPALNLVKHDTELLNRKGYREITAQIFDEFINYKMKTGQHSDAHFYNEIKKLLIASSKCGTNLFKYAAGIIDMNSLQQSLPENGIYVNVAKNKNDLFVWAADKKSKKAFIIEQGYESFQKFKTIYDKSFVSGKEIKNAAREITGILSSVNSIVKNKQVIIISADSDTEKIPYEIIGDDKMISDKSLLMYIPSLLVSTAGNSSFAREIYLPESDNSLQSFIGKTAIRESGMKYNSKTGSERGMTHISSGIIYNRKDREYTVNGKDINSLIGSTSVLFAPTEGIRGAGYTEFLLAGRRLGLLAALLNVSSVQDTNSALFIEEFYHNAGKGASLQESFTMALNKIKGINRYSHPVYWSGFRLNIYNLNLLKEK